MKHLMYENIVRSQTATRLGIDNTPNHEQLTNALYLIMVIYDWVTSHLSTHVYISSFFRSEELNNALGGAKNSQHTKGQAMDLDADMYGGTTNFEIFNYIKDNLQFDQLIWEYGDDDNPAWVHVSIVCKGKNRKQVLRARKINGKTKYEVLVQDK